MRKNIKFIILSLAVILSLSFAAFAQGRTGTIEGTATDTNGAIVPNATVNINGASFKRTVNANEEGFYRVIDVPPGDYTVSIEVGNFKTDTRNVSVVIDKASVVDFQLVPGTGTVTIDVNANDAVGIDPTDSKIQTTLTARELENLPKGNNFSSALKAAAAVRPEVTGGGFQIDGASGSENTFVIDGQEVTNFRTGTLNASNNVPFQQVQEIQIKSNGFEAQFGGATGGVINIVTKRGDNVFHGEAGMQIETSKLFASPRSVLSSSTTVLRYFRPAKDQFTNTFPSLVLSGPIIKNRLNFFMSYTPQFRNTTRNFQFPSGSRISYRSEDRRDYAFVRLDSEVFSKLRVSATYLYNPVRINGDLPGFNFLGSAALVPGATAENSLPTAAAEFDLGGRIPATNVTAEAFYTPTQNLSFNVRFGRSYLNEKIDAYGVPNAVNYSCSTGAVSGNPCATGFALFPGGNSATFKDISVRRTFDAIATYYVSNFGGRHIFKGGYQYNGISNDVATGNTGTGQIDFSFGGITTDRNGCPRGVVPAGTPIPPGCSVNPDPTALGVGSFSYAGAIGKVSSRNDALFFQDSWQPFSRLTLNLGIRIERENVPTFDAAVASGITFGFGDKIAPRLGFAYDVLGNGKWKIFASYGRFFDRFKYELPRGSFGGETFQQYDFVFTNTNIFAFTPASIRATNVNFTDFRIPAFIDPDIQAFRQSEFTGGTEFEFGQNFIFAARYTHKQVDRAVEDIGFHVGTGTMTDEQYVIGNPGFGRCARAACGAYDIPGFVAPKAERKYDAVEFRVDRRFANNYFFNASYTYSRLFGNYAGLASSDEAQRGGGTGRNSPNVNRNFDVPYVGFTADGKPDNGLLPTDRPHVFKITAGYSFDWFGSKSNQTNVNVFQVVQSGTPVTSRFRIVNVSGQILSKRGDLGRTDTFAQSDFSIAHRYNFGRDNKYGVVFDVNILNLLNSATELSRRETLTRLNVPISTFGCTDARCIDRGFFNGTITSQKIRDYAALGTVTSPNKDQRYNQPQLFQDPRSIRFGFRFMF